MHCSKFYMWRCKFQLPILVVWLTGMHLPLLAVDLQSFEFNDPNGTELSSAANTASPGNQWTTSETQGVSDMLPSDVQSGSYRVIKDFDGLGENWLQIDNVASGKLYLVARMANWKFTQALADDPTEEIRFGFLNDDTGNSGNVITAEMRIRRNSDTSDIELSGRALGTNASLIPNTVGLATEQTQPFTAVLEVDFDQDCYKVFYKDGTSPSQLLGQGAMAPTRAANSVRFAANNNFGSTNFYPTVIDEQFNIDRIAVTDTNPLTDLLNVTVNRDSGAISLVNDTGITLSNLETISIGSSSGSLNLAGWKPVTNNYDQSPPGDGTVDSNGTWSITGSSASMLSEMSDGGDGGTLEVGQSVALSTAAGVWLQSPFEDVTVTLGFAGGVSRSANVTFEGNGGERFMVGDLNFDGQITSADWSILIANAETDLSGLTEAEAYRQGDLDGDFVNSIVDVGVFKDLYESANGPGSFATMLAKVPEPGSVVIISLLALGVLVVKKRCGRVLALLAAGTLLVSGPLAQAVVLEDFPFGDVNGATLGEVDNTANPGNSWNEDSADMTESAVLDGVFHIQKNNEGFGTNFLQIDNITSSKAWLVAEIAGWNFTPNLGTGEGGEEIRFGFLNNDTGEQGGSTITARAMIARNDSGGIEITGAALGGGTPIAATQLSLTQSNPFSLVLGLDKTANTYEISIKDGNSPFVSVGSGNVAADRGGNSIRFTVNNGFGGSGEFFDIDRIYLTDENPIMDAVEPLTLRVNLASGQTWIANDSTVSYEIDSYRISDANTPGALSAAGWNSFSEQMLDAVDGPDGDSTVGNGIGETWDEAGGSGPSVLAESFLHGSTLIGIGEQLSIGTALTPGSSPDLAFEYRLTGTGAILQGLIEFVTVLPGDYNGDDVVNIADYTVWRNNLGAPAGTLPNDTDGGVIGSAQYVTWKNNFGAGQSASIGSSAIPEPCTWALAGVAAGLLSIAWRPRFRVTSRKS